jgi:hypothetical protein
MQTTLAKDEKQIISLGSCQHRLIVEPAIWQKYFALLTEPTNHNKTNVKN